MSYVTGTATSAENLFALFRTFITSDASLAAESPSQVWVEEDYSSVVDGNGNNELELSLRGPGLGASDSIYVNLRLTLQTAAGTDAWNMSCFGATSYNNTLTFETMPGTSINPKVMPMYDQSMPYWFFANGRRFMIIAQVTSSVYVNCYCGFILPFSPSVAALEYTYPLYIGASMADDDRRFSDTNSGANRAFWDPAYDSATVGGGTLYTPGNSWLEFINFASATSTSTHSSFSSTPGGSTVPYVGCSYSGRIQADVVNQEPLLGGTYLLTDVMLVEGSDDDNEKDAFGVLDGVVHISGVSQASQNTVVEGADTYTVFQEGFHTGQENYAALKQ